MILTKKALSRRTVLRGIGTTLALPLLDAMVPAYTPLLRAAGKPTLRYGVIYLPNGVNIRGWTPTIEGTDHEFSPTLKPLAPFRDRVLIVSGLDDDRIHGGDHTGAPTKFLTAVPPKQGIGQVAASISVDQMLADHLGRGTQLPSLQMSLEGYDTAGSCSTNGYSCVYTSTISWRDSTTPLPTERNPRAVFERLFGDSETADPQLRIARGRKDRSILAGGRGDVERSRNRQRHPPLDAGGALRLGQGGDVLDRARRASRRRRDGARTDRPHVGRRPRARRRRRGVARGGGASVDARTRVKRVRMTVGGNDLETAVDVEEGGLTPLFFAARSGDVATGRLLVSAGANVNDLSPDRTSVLAFAAFSGQGEFAAFLLEQGADPSADGPGYTPLHAAVLRGDVVLVKALLGRGARVNAVLKQGTRHKRAGKDYAFLTKWTGATPFWLAARFAETGIMRALVAGGADATLGLPDGTTPLTVAAGVGLGQAVREDRRNRRRDPLEYVALARKLEQETFDAVTFVLGTGTADVNAVNRAGDTAVHGAVTGKDTAVVKLLADHGARLDVANKRGLTPFGLASRRTRGEADEGDVDAKMLTLPGQYGVTR